MGIRISVDLEEYVEGTDATDPSVPSTEIRSNRRLGRGQGQRNRERKRERERDPVEDDIWRQTSRHVNEPTGPEGNDEKDR